MNGESVPALSPPASVTTVVTWWGHATTTIELDGCRVLTDPIFATRLAHLRRIGGPAPKPAAHRADVVVISHLHRDHLHLPSLAQLDPDVRIIAPRGAAAVLAASGPDLAARAERVEEVRAGDVVTVGPLLIDAVPAAHDARRAPGSKYRATAIGYRIRRAAEARPRVWFAGDTGLFDGMSDLGPVDIAVVPVGGWGPTLGPEHLDPVQACEAVRRVQAVDAVPIYFGTYWPLGLRWAHPVNFRRCFREPGERFVAEATRTLGAGVRPHLLGLGGSVNLRGQR